MTHRAQSSIETIGSECEPLIVLDGFAPDPDALRAFAQTIRFEPAGDHYPGIRATLSETYLATQLPVIASAIGRAFGRCRRLHVVDARFSIVTRSCDALSLAQRLPHVDAYGRERIALVHYLSPEDGDGTAFFRHRSTGFETIDATRKASYTAALTDELATADEPRGYIAGDTDLFAITRHVAARYNRALIYRSYLLHSGAISAAASLSPDPERGRLTVTAFLTIE